MRLAVCSFLEPADTTVFASAALPLHVTVLGNFILDADFDEFASIVTAAARMLPITVHLGTDEVFGANGEYQVTVTEPSVSLTELHNELLDRARRVGAVLDNPEYGGDGYRAHVTWPGNVRPALAAVLTLASLSIVELEPDGDTQLRRVMATA